MTNELTDSETANATGQQHLHHHHHHQNEAESDADEEVRSLDLPGKHLSIDFPPISKML